MSISAMHADMRDEIKGQGPLCDKLNGTKLRQNRGVARAHKAAKRAAAAARDVNTAYDRTKGYRRGMGLIGMALKLYRKVDCGHDFNDVNDEMEHLAYCERVA